MKTLHASVLFLLSCLLLSPSVLFSAGLRSVGTQANTTWTASHTWLNINNISTQFRNDGQFDWNPANADASAFEFPKGSRKYLVYESGLLWGLRSDSLHVCGSTYISGLQPGKIVSPGVPEDPNLPKNRIYRVRPDYTTADLSSEVRDEGRSAEEIRSQYETDWNNWPATNGAPYNDSNSNGIYEPRIDVPGFKGADQTIWFVCNDLDSGRTRALYETEPAGIEMQVTVWAYNRSGSMRNMLFKNYRLYNKSTAPFDSMFVAQWMDTHIGEHGDEFAGCDTTLDLWFCYNSASHDQEYGSLTPPVIGFQFPTMRTYAMVQKWTGSSITDPPFTSAGSRQWYNWMRGLLPIGGGPFVDPRFPGQQTRFWIDGDPVSRTGRIDGYFAQAGNRRGHSAVGPSRMLPGEVRDIPIVIMAAIGSNNITGITELRRLARSTRANYPLLADKIPPRVNAAVLYPTSSQATVQLIVDDRPSHAASLMATLRRQDGASVSQVALYDDGVHSDSAANDAIWGNSVTIAREGYGLYVDVTVNSDTWERLYEPLTVCGAVQLTNPRVFSDNINNNGEVNPGENIRYGFHVTNGSMFYLGGIGVSTPAPDFRFIRFNPLLPGESDSLRYNGSDTLTYFSFTAPESGIKTIPFSITDTAYNRWNDTLRFSVLGQNGLPTSFELLQNYPNPFNPSTTIGFEIPASVFVSLKLYNVLGQEVATLVNEVKQAGRNEVVWNSSGHTSGVYFYRLQSGEFLATKKLIIIR